VPDNAVKKAKGKVKRSSRAAIPKGGLPFAQKLHQLSRRMGTAKDICMKGIK